MLLEGKGYIVQEFYNEYLDLKVEISERTKNLEYIKRVGTVTTEGLKMKKDKIDEKVNRMRFVLQELQLNGVKLEDLILLSLGVDVK